MEPNRNTSQAEKLSPTSLVLIAPMPVVIAAPRGTDVSNAASSSGESRENRSIILSGTCGFGGASLRLAPTSGAQQAGTQLNFTGPDPRDDGLRTISAVPRLRSERAGAFPWSQTTACCSVPVECVA
jgi:hypothetical protein